MSDNEEVQSRASQVGVGPRLKAARESAGLSLAQVAGQTKIPSRMLVLIEAGDFAALPARTYATGFTRTYARALGLDDALIVADVRAELGMHEAVETRLAPTFEPGDPSRVPSARFAWLAAVAALAVVAAGLFYYNPAVSLPSLLPEESASAAPPVAAPTLQPPAMALPSGETTMEPTDAATASPAQRAVAAQRSNPAGRAPAARRANSSTAAPSPGVPLEGPVTPPALTPAAPPAVPPPPSTTQN